MQEFKLDMYQTHPKLDKILETLQGLYIQSALYLSLSLSLSFSLSLDVSPREVFHHGSLPAKYLFTWVSACSAVLEHSSSAGKEVLVEHLKANNDDDEESITSY